MDYLPWRGAMARCGQGDRLAAVRERESHLLPPRRGHGARLAPPYGVATIIMCSVPVSRQVQPQLVLGAPQTVVDREAEARGHPGRHVGSASEPDAMLGEVVHARGTGRGSISCDPCRRCPAGRAGGVNWRRVNAVDTRGACNEPAADGVPISNAIACWRSAAVACEGVVVTSAAAGGAECRFRESDSGVGAANALAASAAYALGWADQAREAGRRRSAAFCAPSPPSGERAPASGCGAPGVPLKLLYVRGGSRGGRDHGPSGGVGAKAASEAAAGVGAQGGTVAGVSGE